MNYSDPAGERRVCALAPKMIKPATRRPILHTQAALHLPVRSVYDPTTNYNDPFCVRAPCPEGISNGYCGDPGSGNPDPAPGPAKPDPCPLQAPTGNINATCVRIWVVISITRIFIRSRYGTTC